MVSTILVFCSLAPKNTAHCEEDPHDLTNWGPILSQPCTYTGPLSISDQWWASNIKLSTSSCSDEAVIQSRAWLTILFIIRTRGPQPCFTSNWRSGLWASDGGRWLLLNSETHTWNAALYVRSLTHRAIHRDILCNMNQIHCGSNHPLYIHYVAIQQWWPAD